MPAKNVIKPYIENGYYHLYNRGAEKHPIFIRKDDYLTFISFLEKYLAPERKQNPFNTLLVPMNLSDEIDLMCFCLMPNHFHFLVRQKSKYAITAFTRRLLSSYAGHFNQKYGHGGGLFQSKLKGILIDSEEYLLHLSRYIHRNPLSLPKYKDKFMSYPFSSYKYYSGENVSWVKTTEILSYFNTAINPKIINSYTYQNFVEINNEKSDELVGDFSLDGLSQQSTMS